MPDRPDPKVHGHPYKRSPLEDGDAPGPAYTPSLIPYAELAVTSNFTFLTGASHPDELISRAADLGHRAVAITDHNTLAGIVRGHVAAKAIGIPYIVGCRLQFIEPAWLSLLVYPTDRASYGRLCRLLTLGKRRAPKGECHLWLEDLVDHAAGLLAIVRVTSPVDKKASEHAIHQNPPRKGWALERHHDDKAISPGVLVAPALQSRSVTESGRPFIAFAAPTPRGVDSDEVRIVEYLKGLFDDDRLSLAIDRLYGADDPQRLEQLAAFGRRTCVPLVAVNDVYYHEPRRRALQDVLVCIRHGCTLEEAGFRLFPNAERYIKPPEEMARLFAEHPAAIARTVQIAERAAGFSLDQLRYEYPHEICPERQSPMDYLRQLTWEGAARHYPAGVPEKVRRQVEYEFGLIEELDYAPYFLTVHDLVAYARSLGILCQGRGAAANSAVCYCLGVTAVDPDRINVLFERFVSRERDEPPDIDIDFEHERREEVIQYIYRKYGRDRAGLTAEVITYRSRSAVRDVGKALGLSLDAVDRIAKHVHDWTDNRLTAERATSLGFDGDAQALRLLVYLVGSIAGFPRHLSQHVGGFVISRGPLCELVPIENAAMEDRTIIEWDKDDIEALGMLKVDVLGLGMLTCIRKAFDLMKIDQSRARQEAVTSRMCRPSDIRDNRSLVRPRRKAPIKPPIPQSLHTIPPEDPRVYDMICRADTIGVFQIESRAQMTMLPRLKPRCYYDLVIEVAIVRPGPIIGDMVHPFLRRRNGEELVVYPDEKVERVLGRTLGVPLFQEQAMALAIVAAGFTPGEAEMLRRTISAWKSRGKDAIPRYRERFINGMLSNGYEQAFAEQCFERLKGFSEYGFPESHSASFALLVYASAWIKCYYPAAFAAALLNSQPMGFYAPAQIVRDARDHGVEIRPVDVNRSDWDCTLEGNVETSKPQNAEASEIDDAASEMSPFSREPKATGGPVLRLGMRMIKGLRETHARQIAATVRHHGPFSSIIDLWRASEAPATSLHILAAADAFGSMGLDRQQAIWAVQSIRGKPLPLFDAPWHEAEPQERVAGLPPVSGPREVIRDYHTTGLSLKSHPMSFLRPALSKRRILTAAQIRDEQCCPHGKWASVAGIVLFRQRPGTAKGVMFMTLEDETGRADLIVRPRIYQRCQSAALYGRIVIAKGRVERDGIVTHILVQHVEEFFDGAGALPVLSRDFH